MPKFLLEYLLYFGIDGEYTQDLVLKQHLIFSPLHLYFIPISCNYLSNLLRKISKAKLRSFLLHSFKDKAAEITLLHALKRINKWGTLNRSNLQVLSGSEGCNNDLQSFKNIHRGQTLNFQTSIKSTGVCQKALTAKLHNRNKAYKLNG